MASSLEDPRSPEPVGSNPAAKPWWRALAGYTMALLLAGCAVAITALFGDKVDPSPAFLVAVMIATWLGGLGPAVLAILASVLLIDYCFVAPVGQITLEIRYLPRVAFFMASAGLVAWLSSARKRAEVNLTLAGRRLEATVRERTAEIEHANQALQVEIAERVRANLELQEHADLLNLTHDTIVVRNLNGTIFYWNRGAETMYGWPAKEAIGRVSHELLRTVFPEPLHKIQQHVLQTDRWEGELLHTTRDGLQRTVASRWALKRDAAGEPAAVLEINHDVSEQRRAEQSVRDAEARLAHVGRVTALGELAASIAHEVNQPLTGIVTNANAALRWLNASPPDVEEVSSAVHRIVRDGTRAGEIIARIRAMVRNRAPESTPLQVSQLIHEVVALSRAQVTRSDALFRLSIGEPLPLVLGDAVQLQQVLLNLILNALESMAAIPAEERHLSVAASTDAAGDVVISVHDTGPGISAGTADQLFRPFFTTKAEGLGMGLSISQSIVRSHGGRITATEGLARGAEFVVCLPGVQPDAATL